MVIFMFIGSDGAPYFSVHGPGLALHYRAQKQEDTYVIYASHNGTELCVPTPFTQTAQAEQFCAYLAENAVFPVHVADVLEDYCWAQMHPDFPPAAAPKKIM